MVTIGLVKYNLIRILILREKKMKKVIFSILVVFTTIISLNAQTAIETSKLLDNTYIGVTGGVTVPLDFDPFFPVNPYAGLKIGKEFTPILGLELEGVAIMNDNHWNGPHTFIKATNLGLNGIINLSNLFCGYKGTPRLVEVKTNTGIGWMHVWDTPANAFTAKTGVDVQFNLGKTKAHSIIITPAVYWNLNKYKKIQFNKNAAQLGLGLTYLYHFKTSNGTHHFKVYDVGAMAAELVRLNEELTKKPTEVVREVVKEVPVTNTVKEVVNTGAPFVVSFAQGSYAITDTAKAVLDKFEKGATVAIDATASPEGSNSFNLELSKKRANAVAEYLKARGVNVESANGLGSTGNDSQRIAKIVLK